MISIITVYLTNHFQERYSERVGKAAPPGQRAWIAKSIKKNKTRLLKEDVYQIKLVGAPFVVVAIRRSRDIWIAKTVKPLPWIERKNS